MIKFTIDGKPVKDYVNALKVGETHIIPIEITNEYNYTATLYNPYFDDENIHILSYPERIGAGQKDKMIIEILLPINHDKPIDTNFGFKGVIIG